MNFTLADHALDLEVLHVLARVGRRREDRFSLEVLLDHRLVGHFSLVDRQGCRQVVLHRVGHFALVGLHQEDRFSLVDRRDHRLEVLRQVDRCALVVHLKMDRL